VTRNRLAAAIRKHSLSIVGHRTSISLESAFWDQLNVLAAERGLSLAALVAEIDAQRGAANLSSAIRVVILESVLAHAPADIPPTQSRIDVLRSE
jgi:predicted DNA-binding ribbon-helix-helix protein